MAQKNGAKGIVVERPFFWRPLSIYHYVFHIGSVSVQSHNMRWPWLPDLLRFCLEIAMEVEWEIWVMGCCGWNVYEPCRRMGVPGLGQQWLVPSLLDPMQNTKICKSSFCFCFFFFCVCVWCLSRVTTWTNNFLRFFQCTSPLLISMLSWTSWSYELWSLFQSVALASCMWMSLQRLVLSCAVGYQYVYCRFGQFGESDLHYIYPKFGSPDATNPARVYVGQRMVKDDEDMFSPWNSAHQHVQKFTRLRAKGGLMVKPASLSAWRPHDSANPTHSTSRS